MSTDKLWTVISGIEYQLNILKDKLKKLDEETKQSVDEAYHRGYDKGYADKTNNDEVGKELAKDVYQRGLDDAWEFAKKLFFTMSETEIEKAFPTEWNNGGFNALINLQPQEAIEKLKAYEEKQKADDEIKVGDEVEISQSDANGIWVVIKVEKHDGYEAYWAINKDGDIYFEEEQDSFTKTGRHFDIPKILEEMRT